MFEIDQLVVHYRDGLAKIVGETMIDNKKYFLLVSVRDDGTTFYVPKDNANQTIRPLMDLENADGILKYMSTINAEFNSNTKQRRDDFKRRIASGNILDIAFLSTLLFLYKNYTGDKPIAKFGAVDFGILEEAQGMLFDELAVVYNVSRNEIADFVQKRIQTL